MFAVDAAAPFYLNGTAETIGIGDTLALSGGGVTQTAASTYLVNWTTGESMTVTIDGAVINESIALTAADAGDVQGLLGPDNGDRATDLQLPDGQSITFGGTVASSHLYGEYANAWQVPDQADSLLYYADGQTPETFIVPGFPADAVKRSQLPTSIVSAVEATVEAEGITDPNLVDAAVIDRLVTGDPNSVFPSLNVQQQGASLSSASICNPTPLPSVGILADAPLGAGAGHRDARRRPTPSI